MTDIQKEIKEALEKATPGPWSYYKNEYMGNYAWVSEWCVNGPCASGIDNETDAHLIANAPTWLLHQQELIEQLREALEFYADPYNYIPTDDYFPSIDKDRGERAKEALSSIGESNEH